MRWDFKHDETYFCIVYAFVPLAMVKVDVVTSQLEFFHTVGFFNDLFYPSNWRGEGVLVDFCDIVSPWAHRLEWREKEYAGQQEHYHAIVERSEQSGALNFLYNRTLHPWPPPPRPQFP